MIIPFKHECAVYAVAFCCRVDPDDARFRLWRAGSSPGDGSTNRQISEAVRALGYRLRRIRTPSKTFRTFARECRLGAFLVSSSDHAAAIIDGNICQRPIPRNSDLMRIETIHKISLDN
jgi:hypothetical protein